MSFARKYDRFQQRGAQIAAVVVDSPEQNRAMIEKLLLPFTILSDPEGDAAIKRYGVWDAEGRIAIPSIVAVGRDGIITWLYKGQDFADRPLDEELFGALSAEAGG